MSFKAQILTLYPDMFPGPLGASLAGRALDDGLWSMDVRNIRDHATGKHRNVDDTPAGGGAGMVLRADVLGAAIDAARADMAAETPLVYLSPRGVPFDQDMAKSFRDSGGVTLICGRFEGVDERVLEAREVKEVSIGDYVLSGGEVAAMVVMDAVVRLLPGVMGADATLDEESFENGLLEYPHYTRPNEWEGREIPPVLTSGDHGAVKKWRQNQAEQLTKARRPDMWTRYLKVAKKKG